VEFIEGNLALFTRQSVQCVVKDEKIFKLDIVTLYFISYEVFLRDKMLKVSKSISVICNQVLYCIKCYIASSVILHQVLVASSLASVLYCIKSLDAIQHK